MTTIKMKSSEAIPTSFVRPKLNPRHHNSIQPLWMRVLEEKYQKLQLKIAQSTATMNGLYSSTIGRTIYDTKLVRASLQRTKDPPQNVKRRNGKFDIKARISATQISSSPGIHTTRIDNGVYRNSASTDNNLNINDGLNSDDDSVNKFDKEMKIKDQSTRVSEILCLRYDKNKPLHRKDISDLLDIRRKQQIPPVSKTNNSGNSSNIQSFTSSRHNSSTQNTVQSCPTNTDDTNVNSCLNNTSRAESAGKSKINRRKMKMFSRMSAEAQTALTETIMENNSEDNTDLDVEDVDQVNIENDDVFGSECVLSYDDIDTINKRDNCNDSEVSMASRDSRSIHTRLPDIPNESEEYLTLCNIQKMDRRVPGIGKFACTTKKETTFEITPPGFDIRYKDAPIREERESETPPPDIRDRAIRKCQDWLSRYTPRTPRPSQTSN